MEIQIDAGSQEEAFVAVENIARITVTDSACELESLDTPIRERYEVRSDGLRSDEVSAVRTQVRAGCDFRENVDAWASEGADFYVGFVGGAICCFDRWSALRAQLAIARRR